MAEYGLRILNKTGFVQIDGNYNNLALRAKGTVIANGQSTALGWRLAIVTVAASTTAIMGFRCVNLTYFMQVTRSGNNNVYVYDCSIANSVIEWFLFDQVEFCPAPLGKSGVQVINKDTLKVAFDSRYQYMKAVGFENRATHYDTPAVRVYQGTNVIVVPSQCGYAIQAAPGGPPDENGQIAWNSYYWRDSIRTSGANVTYSFQLVDQAMYPIGFPQPPSRDQPYSTFLVLDGLNL